MSLGCPWDVLGMSLGCPWDVLGMSLGMSLGCPWDVLGMSLRCPLKVYEKSLISVTLLFSVSIVGYSKGEEDKVSCQAKVETETSKKVTFLRFFHFLHMLLPYSVRDF